MNVRIEEINAELNALHQLLDATDYKAIKYSEGFITEDDYAETKALRQSYRDKINELEEELNTLDE